MLRDNFIRSVGVLVGGTALAQVLTLLALPLLTRLYTPEDFGVLAVYASILGIVSVGACLRFEIAIPLPQRDDDAANLLVLALCSSAGVTGLSAFIVAMLPANAVALMAQPKLQPFLWLLPLGIWLSSSYAALQFWTTRKKRFSIIAKTRLTQAIGGVGAQVGLGWAGIAPLGLLLGQIFNSGAGILGLARDAFKNERALLYLVNWSGMRRVLFEYRNFPKYLALQSLVHSVSAQLPVIVIAASAAGAEAGFFMLASRVIVTPLELIGNAVSQVYLSRAPDELRAGTLGKFTANIMGGLVKTGIGPLIFAGIVAPVAFPVIFGAQWQRAAEMAVWLTPWFLVQFLTSPISMTLDVTQSYRAGLVLQIIGIFMRIGVVVAAAYWAPYWIVESYAMSVFLYYTVYLCVVLSVAKVEIKDMLKAIGSGGAIVSLWILLAILTRIIL